VSDQLSTEPHTILDSAGCVAVDLACVSCRYNLRSLPVDGKCPECGHLVTETTAGYLPTLDREGRVDGDLLCVNCGYNLRTMPATGVCPECAARVALSARGHYLHVAPPAWVKRLANGALLLMIAMICSIALPIIWAIFSFVGALAAGAGQGISDGMLWLLGGLIIAAGVACLWLTVRGLLHLTAREPGQEFRGEGLSARRLVRYSLLAVAILTLGTFVFMFPRPIWLFGPGVTMLTGFSVVAVIVYMLLPLALLRHIMALMRRIPRPGLVTFAKIEFWGGLISGVLYVGSYTLMMVATFRAIGPLAAGAAAPMTPYAAGPNTPGVAATTSAPALTALGYIPATATSPGRTVTTAPTSAPVVMTPPAFGPALGIAVVLSVASSCGMLIIGIAGFVLLILVWRALANAARLAEQNAPPNTAQHRRVLHVTP
jgi:hypothetical protein